MACPGGCLGGGGEPKSDDPDVLKKRAKGIYDIDAGSAIRKSHENAEVQQLYKDFLGHPLSEISERLLHTSYAARGSPRDMLGRFLDAVDHRDGAKAASLFADNGMWNTNTPSFGQVEGSVEIVSTITGKLPPIEKVAGTQPPRHRLASTVEGTDVFMPDGEKVHFQVELDDSTGRIKALSRIPVCEDMGDMDACR